MIKGSAWGDGEVAAATRVGIEAWAGAGAGAEAVALGLDTAAATGSERGVMVGAGERFSRRSIMASNSACFFGAGGGVVGVAAATSPVALL